jgi:hypothetical protein
MDEAKIKEKLKAAVEALFTNQPNLFEFTSETGQTEWNVAHHLAIEVHKNFPGLDCDLDIVKVNLEKRRPDIIFHKRGTHKSNFLVIEVKRDGLPAEIRGAKEKIRSSWFGDRLNYRFGAVINIKGDKTCQIEVFQNRKASSY